MWNLHYTQTIIHGCSLGCWGAIQKKGEASPLQVHRCRFNHSRFFLLYELNCKQSDPLYEQPVWFNKLNIPVFMKTFLVSNLMIFFNCGGFFVTLLFPWVFIVRGFFYASKKQFWKCHETLLSLPAPKTLTRFLFVLKCLRKIWRKKPFLILFWLSKLKTRKGWKCEIQNVYLRSW